METELYTIDWQKYLKPRRESHLRIAPSEDVLVDCKEFEEDLRRVIFCPALRRMHDKTQVIPLTSGDTILTRLTHSLQVMGVAESLAHKYTRTDSFKKNYGEDAEKYDACISAILRTASLLHDIGNPPFGHFGEISIQNYFKDYLRKSHIMPLRQQLDFTQFDGNALGLRIVSKLQYSGSLFGLNLSYPTLAAYLKYPNKGKANKEGSVGNHKHGVFFTEETLFNDIVKHCNMEKEDDEIKRHPLAFLVEAADSICYGTTDMEDGYNAQWYSFDEMVNDLNRFICDRVESKANGSELLQKHKDENNQFSIEKLIGFDRKLLIKKDENNKIIEIVKDKKDEKDKIEEIEKDKKRLIVEFRVKLIEYLSNLTIENFKNNLEKIDKGEYNYELLEEDDYEVSGALGDFAKYRLISRRDIQQLELTGNSVINGLFNILIRFAFNDDSKYRSKIKAVIAQSRVEATIHENLHKDDCFKLFDDKKLWKFDIEELNNYSKLRLIVDFVASMTDKYSVELYQKLSGLRL